MPVLPYPAKDKGYFCSILQAKSIPSFIDFNLTYLFDSSQREHIFCGSIIFIISNQFTLSSILATQNALPGHLRVLLPSMMSRNSSGVSFKSQRHCLSILFCSSVSSLLSMYLLYLKMVSGQKLPHHRLQDYGISVF